MDGTTIKLTFTEVPKEQQEALKEILQDLEVSKPLLSMCWPWAKKPVLWSPKQVVLHRNDHDRMRMHRPQIILMDQMTSSQIDPLWQCWGFGQCAAHDKEP